MEIVLSKARIEVNDCFEDLINDIDVKVELFFADNRARIRLNNDQPDALFVKINEWREACIEEIRECKNYNLSLIDNQTAQLPLKQRITRFCFLTDSFMDTIYNSDNEFGYTLFSTDKYLTKGEITCFQTLLKYMPGAQHDAAINQNKYKYDKAQLIKGINELFIGFEQLYHVRTYLSIINVFTRY
jgi:hypothetical protein